MSAEVLEGDPRFPIGRFQPPATAGAGELRTALRDLAELPALLRVAVAGLDEAQLETPYRVGGWTVRQVVHHVADSHMNLFIRVRKALTEEAPVIAAYDEGGFAELGDSAGAPLDWSLGLLEGLHARWGMMLGSLSEAQWKRRFVHPESGPMSVEQATLLYGWHGRHHVAHITTLRKGQGW